MGVVYRAEDTKLKRTVALKFLTPQALGTEEEKTRFVHEAQAAAALNHSNICTVYEIDESEGPATAVRQSFIAMEYIEGQSLREKVDSGPLKLNEAVELAIQVSEGLQKAHDEGVVHRDIKSANIMVTEEGQAKIMDFGLAKLAGRTKLTKTGTTLGTTAYMSPEQTRGDEVDHRTDIWSLGVVLYEMVTGQLPFKGEYDQAVVYSIMNEESEAMTGLRTGVPMELERITNKALAKSPDERYQHVDEIEADLKILKKELETPVKVQPLQVVVEKSRKKRFPKEPEKKPVWHLPAYALAVLTIVVLGAIFYSTIFKEPSIPVEDQVNPKSVAVLPFSSITKTEDAESFTDGIHDDILTQLVKIRDLKVIARTSVMKYRNTEKRISEIGKELGVAYVLEGSVRRAGGRIRIVSQLIDVKTDEHLWAETYDRDYTDIFAIQSDVAQKIASALKATLTPEEKRYIEQIPTGNMEAYDYFLKGNYYWHTKTDKEGNLKAVDMYERAIELDPDFALAYARLSIVHSGLYANITWDHTEERLLQAKTTLEKALQLGPDQPDVHFASGVYHEECINDYERALEEYKAAYRGQPNNSEIAGSLGHLYLSLDRWDRAEEYLFKSYELDPKGLLNAAFLGWTYVLARNWVTAKKYLDIGLTVDVERARPYWSKALYYISVNGDIEKARETLEEGIINVGLGNPTLPWYRFWIEAYARDYQQALAIAKSHPIPRVRTLLKGFAFNFLQEYRAAKVEFDSARVIYEQLCKDVPKTALYHSRLGWAYAMLGMKEEAIQQREKAIEIWALSIDAGWGHKKLLDWGHFYVMIGEYDQAIDQFESLLSVPSTVTKWILKLDPILDPLRDNPRFQKLIEIRT